MPRLGNGILFVLPTSSTSFHSIEAIKFFTPMNINIDVEARMIQAALYIYARCEEWGVTYVQDKN